MKLRNLLKSRTISFNAIIGAVIPIWNHVAALAFPQLAITAELANNVLVLGNLALRMVTDSAITDKEGGDK